MMLTEIQRKILHYIEEETAERGSPPTLRAIRDAFRFKAVSTVQGHVKALLQKGFLTRDPGKARGVRLADRHRTQAMGVPLLGSIAAGIPREATELILDTIAVPPRIARKGETYALRVQGESMIGAGIFDGDVVIVRKQPTYRDGDIVVALVDGEATVKRLRKELNRTVLEAENPNYSPIPIDTRKDYLQGKVVGVQRYYE